MAPQASLVPTSTVQPSSLSTPAPASAGPKPWVPIPVAFSIFLGLCLAYTLSYLLYRIVMSRRSESEDDIPDSPDRGVSQFMNGARLTLNLGHNHKSTPLTLNESPDIPDEEKPLTDPPRPAHSEVPASSPPDPPSSPFIFLTPPFNVHPEDEPGEAQLQEQRPTKVEPSIPASTLALAPAPAPAPAQQSFSQRVAAKVKLLSGDRAEAITLDPKLAPVQGPLRPLSMDPGPSRGGRTNLFGLGLKHPRGQAGDPQIGSEAQ